MREVYLTNPSNEDFEKIEGESIQCVLTNSCNCALTDFSLASISRIRNLEELDLEWATQNTDQGLLHLAGEIDRKRPLNRIVRFSSRVALLS